MLLFFIMGCSVPATIIPTKESTPITNSPGQTETKPVDQTTHQTVTPFHAPKKIAFSVGPDQAPVYPKGLSIIPDEHMTIMAPAAGSDPYLMFAANIQNAEGLGGPVVLETKDMQTFTFATGYARPVMNAPYALTTCKDTFDPEFDLNYAGPGSVVQDPTQPAGHLIMIYEAENHCPGGVWQHFFYATIGFARSTDYGKTWPAPIDKELGGPNRYPVLKGSTLEPITAEANPEHMGDALPSAFVDKNFLYVTYLFAGPGGDGRIRVARGQLGSSGEINFKKWYNGAFSEPGIGGQDSPVLPTSECDSENMGQISYNDALDLYMLTFVCKFQGEKAAWYFSTATSLELENWTVPQLIANSEFPMTTQCGKNETGKQFDGWYPSFMSPGVASGHLSNTGYVFFSDGCDSGPRSFMSRTFAITGP